MTRIAQIMFLHPDAYPEYARRHAELWPEMQTTLKAYGATNYSIFLNRENGELFAYLEVPDARHYQQIAETVVCKRWWAYMAPLMRTNPDHSPYTLDLDEVFHLD